MKYIYFISSILGNTILKYFYLKHSILIQTVKQKESTLKPTIRHCWIRAVSGFSEQESPSHAFTETEN